MSKYPKIARTIWLTLILLINIAFTLEAGWSPPFNISSTGIPVNQSDIAINDAGNAFAAWHNAPANDIQVAASPFDGVTIITLPGSPANQPQVVATPNGNVVAVLRSNNNVIKASFFQSGVWSAPVPISAVGGNPGNPQIAIDQSGNVVATWSRIVLGNRVIEAAFLPANTTVFNAPQTVSNSIAGQIANNPSPAIISPENAVIVWTQNISGAIEIQASTSTAFGPWSTPVTISGGLVSSFPFVSMNAAGMAVAVWNIIDGVHNVVQAANLQFGGTWSAPINISDPNLQSASPVVGIDSSGKALIAWDSLDASGLSTILTAVLPFRGTPSAPIAISHAIFALANPIIAVNPAGNVVVVWTESNDAGTIRVIFASEALFVGGPFTAPVPISPLNELSFDPHVVLNAKGQALASWQNNTIFAIQGSNGIDLFPTPPSNLVGKVIKNEFLTQTDRIHRLTWTPSTDPDIVVYRIFRNGVLIATIPASGPFVFNDHHRSKDVKDVYILTAVNSAGLESSTLSVTLR